MSTGAVRLVERVTCPHCSTTFPPEEVLWVSCHADLRGDVRLGPEHLLRFLPSSLDANGNALDAKGLVCRELACPRCHQIIPRQLLETEQRLQPITGAPPGASPSIVTATVS